MTTFREARTEAHESSCAEIDLMPRKKRDPSDLELVPDSDFEDAVRTVLNAPKDTVTKQLAKMQASNKRKREQRKRKRSADS